MANIMKNTIEMLISFVNQRPGLDFADYGDAKIYNAESREITKDRNDFFELLALFNLRYAGKANAILTTTLTNSDGRLTLTDGRLVYTSGQYFPTEYRPAACRVLSNLIWQSYMNEIDHSSPTQSPVYKDGHEIRKAIKRNLSRRVGRNYFN